MKNEKSASDFMPKDEFSCRILNERAKQLAMKIEVTEVGDTINYIRFRLGKNEYYGIGYQNVQEIIDHIVLTKIPCVPEFIAGVTNYRGSLLTLIDLKKFFQIELSDYPQDIFVIVTKINKVLVGVLADNIEGISEYDKEKMESKTSYQGNIIPEYILGLHEGVTTILNMENIIMDLENSLNKVRET